jgi:hypothetical protein
MTLLRHRPVQFTGLALLTTGQLGHAEGSSSTGSPSRAPGTVVGVYESVTPDTQEALAASITPKKDGTEFLATFTPMRTTEWEYIPVLSEAKLTVSTNTDSRLTRGALTFGYNPFAIASERGRDVVDSTIKSFACDGAVQGIGSAQLERDQAKIQLADAEAKLNALTGTSDIAAFSQAHARVDAARRRLEKADGALKKLRTDEERADECRRDVVDAQWKKINETFIPQASITAFANIFPGGSSTSVDNDTTTTDTFTMWGGWGIEPGLSFHFRPDLGLAVWYRYARERASGAGDAELATYNGAGATASFQFWDFLSPADLKKSVDYVQGGFIPGVALGASIQILRCDGDSNCKDRTIDSSSATPFVDVRVTQTLQVRLAVPVAKVNKVAGEKDGEVAEATLTFAGSISAL